MNTLRLALFASGALAILSVQDAARWEKMLQQSKLTLQQAAEIGQKEVPGATLFHVELEQDGPLVFSIDLAQGKQSVNVIVDAASGKVIGKELEDEDHSREVAPAKVALLTAVQTGLAKSPGQAVEAELLLRAGHPMIELKLVQGGKLSKLDIDAVSGKPVDHQAAAPAVFTDVFQVEKGELGPDGVHPCFSLQPGYVLHYEGKDEGQDATLTITVLDATRTIDGVETRVIEEHETLGGQVVEVSRNFFAISKRTNSVYYFGEEVDIYRGGKIVEHSGAWSSGVNGARFGLIMPGTPLVGARYYQEIAPGVAMDRAEIVAVDDTFDTPAGKFSGCLRTEETTPLEKGREHKTYAWGVGLLNDGPLKLVRYGQGAK